MLLQRGHAVFSDAHDDHQDDLEDTGGERETTASARREATCSICGMQQHVAEPVSQRSIEYAGDISLYSLTKYVGGYSEQFAGAALGSKHHQRYQGVATRACRSRTRSSPVKFPAGGRRSFRAAV
jgi:O-acetylhomoserine/O-acetylserine sulfhydrylase-like pyridoxal-dependent enzyme